MMKRIALYMVITLIAVAQAAAQGFGFPPGTMPGSEPTVIRINAPEWVAPMPAVDADDNEPSMLNLQAPMLQWTPIVTSGTPIAGITYDLRIVEVMPDQAPDQAIRRNPKVFETRQLVLPQCLLPHTVTTGLRSDALYAAQITTRVPAGAKVQLSNNGKSRILLFRVAVTSTETDK